MTYEDCLEVASDTNGLGSVRVMNGKFYGYLVEASQEYILSRGSPIGWRDVGVVDLESGERVRVDLHAWRMI